VTVTNPDNLSGVLYNAFTYTTILQISNVSPSSGPPSGGTTVTITGTLFQAGATVQFGGTPALNVTVINATTISCTTPAHSAGVANVVVTNPDATFATLPGGFTFALPLTVANVLPSQASTGGGIPVTVNGMNFTAGCQVTFGQKPASDVNVVNSTQLTCILPWGVAGNVDVVVAHATGGAGTLTNGFTYVQNYVVRFDGSDDVIDCGTSTTMDGFSAATFEAWFRINQSTNYGAVFHRNGGGTSCYSVQTDWQKGQFSIHIPTHNFFYSNANLPLDKWIHIACVYTGTNMLMFLNGKLDRQQVATGTIRSLATAKTYVGSENTTQNTFFNGWIDEARISNVARYSGNFAPPAMLTSDANTVLLLHMDEGSGTQTTDASGLGNHGTLVNSPTWTSQDLGLQPAITGVVPNAGPGAGGTSIQISGQDFMAGAVVKVGGVYAKNIVIVDCTSITCDTPSGSLGFADIEVINPGDLTATFTNGFTYQ